jgi:hypothetical protein
MKWEPDGPGYKILHKGYEINVRPFGADMWHARIAHKDIGYSYTTQQFKKMEDAAKRAFAVIDAR